MGSTPRLLDAARRSQRLALLLAALSWAADGRAATFVVDTTADLTDARPGDGVCAAVDGTCSLRAAVQEANAWPGADEIDVPAGTYVLSIPGATDAVAATGDLDVTESLTVRGAGAAGTIVDAAALDRVLEVQPSAALTVLEGLTLQGGDASASTGRNGGAVVAVGTEVRLTDCTLRDSTAPTGPGGALVAAGTVTITRCTITGCSADRGGGVALGLGTVTIQDSRVEDNTGRQGGGILVQGSTVLVQDSVVVGNTAELGGGLRVEGGDVTLERCDVRANVAAAPTNGRGGGLELDRPATLTLRRCSVRDNTADYGGGLRFGSTTTGQKQVLIEDSTFSGNAATSQGGGLLVEARTDDVLVLVNSTVSDNTARTSGAGIQASNSLVTILSCTIAGNHVEASGGSTGAGVWAGVAVRIGHAILAGNTERFAASDCWGTLDSAGHLLLESSAGCTVTGDTTTVLAGSPALLGPLQDHGGPTLTRAPLTGSPAIDGGDPAGCLDAADQPLVTDQRGADRVVDGDGDGTARCDLGAHEVDASSGGLAINRSVVLGGSGAAPPVASAFDAACRQPSWRACPDEVVPGGPDGLVLPGEAAPTGTPSLWLYEHSEAGDLDVGRAGDDVVFFRR